MKFDEKANELVAAYGEACKAFAWFRPHSLRDMQRAENALKHVCRSRSRFQALVDSGCDQTPELRGVEE